MRYLIKRFVKTCAETLPISEPVYEFGALQVPGQEGFANLRPYFQGKKYVGADMQAGPGVDVVMNLHQIELPSESVGTVLILDTLEHVEDARKAVEEAYRILRPNGVLVIGSSMNFPIHNYPYDYWRFTPEAFKSLLKPFETAIVESAGAAHFPHTIVGIGVKGVLAKEVQDGFVEKLGAWKTRENRSLTNIIMLLVPTALMPLAFGCYRKLSELRNRKKTSK